MTTFVALLRGINVGGNRMLPMADLRACIAAAGFAGVRSYIASGNLLLEGDGDAAEVENRIEAAVKAEMRHDVESLVRTASAWQALIAANPFPDAARERPKMLHLAVSKRPLAATAAESLRSRLLEGERLAQAEDALWIDFAHGAGATKLSPAMIDRAAGATVTARNWNTVARLAALAEHAA